MLLDMIRKGQHDVI